MISNIYKYAYVFTFISGALSGILYSSFFRETVVVNTIPETRTIGTQTKSSLTEYVVVEYV